MIAIHNIYYMLSYAFQVLNKQGYKDIETEEFDNTAELCSAILAKGISQQLKHGLQHEYIPKTDTLSTLRGKMDISGSIKDMTLLRNRMVCTYDDFSVDCYMNRIIKTTVYLLLRSDISKARKKELRKLMVYFRDIKELDIYRINWNVQYNKNNQTYRMLLSVCYLVIKGLLQTQSDGTTKLMEFADEQRLCRLYEKFILEYYRREFPEIDANASQIPWGVDDGIKDDLPIMQTDITLAYKGKVLIIDAKFYERTMQSRFYNFSLFSGNLYQIFTYVKNKEIQLKDQEHEITGMLLYAATDEEKKPNNHYLMGGNKIVVRTLDLNQQFQLIAGELDKIAENYLGVKKTALN